MPDIQTIDPHPAQVYPGVTGDQCLTCRNKMNLDIFLGMRHV